MAPEILPTAWEARTIRSLRRVESIFRENQSARRVAWLVGVPLAVVVLALLYLRLSATVPVNSDDSVFVLQGQAIGGGNVLLRGWTLPADTFLTTDLPLYALLVAVRGVSPGVVHAAGAIVYSVLVVAAALLARSNARGTEAWLRMLVAAALLAAPASPPGVALLLLGPYHTGTTVFLLAGLLALAWCGTRWYGILAFFVLLALNVAANPLALYVGTLAVAAVAGIRLLTAPAAGWRMELALLVAALAAGGVGTRLRSALSAAGGYTQISVPSEFTQLQNIPHNVQLALEGWLLLFGADFFGRPIGAAIGLPLLRALGCGLVIVVATVALARWARGTESDRINQILVAVMACDLVSFVSSTQAIDLRSARYLVPFIAAGAVLAARVGVPLLRTRRLRGVAAVLAALYVALLPISLRLPVAPQPEGDLAAWLVQHNLRYGLGSYWDSNAVTVSSHDRVRVRAVSKDGVVLRSSTWESDRAWYDPGRNDARFLVFDPSHAGQVSTATATATFGPPAETHHVGTYTVLVWHKNLLESLPR